MEEDSPLPVAVDNRLLLGHLIYRRMLQNLDQASNISSGLHVKGEEMLPPTRGKPSKVMAHGQDETQSQVRRIFLHVPMMISPTASTNALSVLARWLGAQESGLAKRAGRYFI